MDTVDFFAILAIACFALPLLEYLTYTGEMLYRDLFPEDESVENLDKG